MISLAMPMTPSHGVEDAALNETDLNERYAITDTQGPALTGMQCCLAVRRVMLAAKKDKSQWYLGDEGESCDSACLNAAGAKCFAHNAACASSSMSPKLLFDAAREAGVACTASEAVTWLPLILPAIIQSRVYNTSGSGGPQNENVQAVCFYRDALQTSTEGGRGRDADRESNKDVDVCGAWEEGVRRLCLCQVEPSYTHQEALAAAKRQGCQEALMDLDAAIIAQHSVKDPPSSATSSAAHAASAASLTSSVARVSHGGPGSSLTSTLAASPASLARRASLTATMHEAYGNQY
jgi:hypothetical protein